MEWRFTYDSVIGVGHWYLNWGDPLSEQLVTLADVIQIADNPVWCLREHTAILNRIVTAVEDLLEDMSGMTNSDGSPARLVPSSPMVFTVARAQGAVQHALALLVDAIVECRKGPIEQAVSSDQALAASLAFTMAEALNCIFRLGTHLPAQSE